MKKVKEDKAKLEMTQFNEGWWNCFLSYSDIIALNDICPEDYIYEQLGAAGVTSEEIEGILESSFLMSERTRSILKGYLNQTSESERYT